MALQTPIAFCIFNRPSMTQQVFARIREMQPARLFVIGDGPRSDRPGEAAQVQACRDVISTVDWDCHIETNYSDVNLGCKQRIATGLDWAFERSEQLIILEDDCLPTASFFGFCENLLARYQHDDRVMMISGDNFQPHPTSQASYYFSRWAHIWGWASWRRAWKHFDVNVKSWPALKSQGHLRSVFGSDDEYQHWSNVLDQQYAGEIDTWDFPWAYACWSNGGLTVLPEQNLVSNIGFGDSATHTTDAESVLARLPAYEIDSLKHPTHVIANHCADQNTWETIFKPTMQPTTPVPKPNWVRRLFKPAC